MHQLRIVAVAADQKRQHRAQTLIRVFEQLVLDRVHLLCVLLLQFPRRALRQLARPAGIRRNVGGRVRNRDFIGLVGNRDFIGLVGKRSVGDFVELEVVEGNFVGVHVGERDLQIEVLAQRVGKGENVLEVLRVSGDRSISPS